MSRTTGGHLVFFTGVAMMIASAVFGKTLQTEMAALGLEEYLRTHSGAGVLPFLLFVFSFPVGLAVCLMGALLAARATARRVGLFGALAIPGVAMVVVVPVVFGTDSSTAYFGIGGVAILILIAVVLWYWGTYRGSQPPERHAAMDLQALGYLCFALAAWNTCGFGSIPSMAVFPEKMIALGTRGFAVGQLKSIMAFLVLGWIFTALGFRKATKRGA
jgi:uncharacterized membrane protein